MSLPRGVVSHPPVVSGHPAAFGGVLRLALRVALVLCPLIAQVAGQVPGRAWQYEARRVEARIREEQEAQRLLRARLAALTDPKRLRREARRLGLSAPPADAPPVVLRRDAAEDGAR
ncbi:MAG: hypothetical protein Kow0062_13720 [Acidobacteriota bacterium]|nr:MAG: hypothetical protein D6738_13045 [Acidobacteriota bacterium]